MTTEVPEKIATLRNSLIKESADKKWVASEARKSADQMDAEVRLIDERIRGIDEVTQLAFGAAALIVAPKASASVSAAASAAPRSVSKPARREAQIKSKGEGQRRSVRNEAIEVLSVYPNGLTETATAQILSKDGQVTAKQARTAFEYHSKHDRCDEISAGMWRHAKYRVGQDEDKVPQTVTEVPHTSNGAAAESGSSEPESTQHGSYLPLKSEEAPAGSSQHGQLIDLLDAAGEDGLTSAEIEGELNISEDDLILATHTTRII